MANVRKDLAGKPQGSVARLGENVWLVDATQSTDALGSLVYWAGRQKLAYGLLPFEHEPRWLPDAFDPNTIQARNAGNP